MKIRSSIFAEKNSENIFHFIRKFSSSLIITVLCKIHNMMIILHISFVTLKEIDSHLDYFLDNSSYDL